MTDAWKGEPDQPAPQSPLVSLFSMMKPPTPAEVAAMEGRLAADLQRGLARWSSLPRYRRFRRCAKCGSWRSLILFHPTSADADKPARYCCGTPPCVPEAGTLEHFFRSCRRCGHYWWERPRRLSPSGAPTAGGDAPVASIG